MRGSVAEVLVLLLVVVVAGPPPLPWSWHRCRRHRRAWRLSPRRRRSCRRSGTRRRLCRRACRPPIGLVGRASPSGEEAEPGEGGCSGGGRRPRGGGGAHQCICRHRATPSIPFPLV